MDWVRISRTLVELQINLWCSETRINYIGLSALMKAKCSFCLDYLWYCFNVLISGHLKKSFPFSPKVIYNLVDKCFVNCVSFVSDINLPAWPLQNSGTRWIFLYSWQYSYFYMFNVSFLLENKCKLCLCNEGHTKIDIFDNDTHLVRYDQTFLRSKSWQNPSRKVAWLQANKLQSSPRW